MRYLWITAGGLCVALGMIGALLPLLPTTPFMLLAAFCFARSSPRLHGWLLAHPTFGPVITRWQAHGAIAPKVKRVAVLTIVGCFLFSVVLGLKPWILAVQGCVLAAVSLFLLTRPDGPPPPQG